jgi:hypothetical protein
LSWPTKLCASASSSVPSPFRVFRPGRLFESFRNGCRNSTNQALRLGFRLAEAKYR